MLTELTVKYDFDAFFSLHSGIRQIYVPFAGLDIRLLLTVVHNNVVWFSPFKNNSVFTY